MSACVSIAAGRSFPCLAPGFFTRAIAFETACVEIWKKSCMRGTEKVERDTPGGSKCGRAKARRLFVSVLRHDPPRRIMPCYKARFDGVVAVGFGRSSPWGRQ